MRQSHPAGLYVLFFTEMWERFGFYTMAALFVLYMKDKTNGYPFLQDYGSLINGLYLGTVYFTPFFGGILADQKLGYRWSIILGALVFGAGYFVLALQPAVTGSAGLFALAGNFLVFFWGGLALIVVGNGLFKPNISTLVGKLYAANDVRLDTAYNIFYMGINLGAFAAPLAAGFLRVRYGYAIGFAAAGVGMILSLLFFLPFQRWLVFTREPLAGGDPTKTKATDAITTPQNLYGVTERRSANAGGVTSPEVPPELQRQRHIALLIIFVVVALFWMGFKQNANTFQLWFRDSTDRVPPAWYARLSDSMAASLPAWAPQPAWLLDAQGWFAQELSASINPFYVIVLTPLLVVFWRFLRARGKEPTTPAKVGLGMVFAAGAFVILAVAGLVGGDQPGVRVSPVWLLEAYAVITVGELCLSPMGLSLVTKLAAPRQRSGWMGGWFAATAVGGYLSGLIGQFWESWTHSVFFAFLGGTSLLAALLLVVFYRRLTGAMPAPRPAPA